MDVHRFELWFGRSREAKQLVDQGVDPVDFVPDQVGEGLSDPELGTALGRAGRRF